MLFLSNGTVDASSRTTTFCQQQQGKTVFHISVILKDSQEDELVSKLGMGRDTHTQVEQRQVGGEIMSVTLMENSPRPGRARQELNRLPYLSCTGTAEVQSEKEGVEGGKMKTDRFLKQPSWNSPALDRDVAQTKAQTDSHKQCIHSTVTLHAQGLVRRDHGSVAGHNSLPRAMLRRPCQGQVSLDRRTLSMYGEPAKQQQGTQPEPQSRLRRPTSVCMLAGPGSVLSEVGQPSRRQSAAEGIQYRSRRAELRAVDGLTTFPALRPLPSAEVTPRVRQRSWKPRPVSMTVLELRKRGSEDDLDSQKGTGRDGVGFFKGGFRWRLFGKAQQEKSKDRESEDSVKLNKSDAPRSTLSSLKRSLSLRIRRTRPRDAESKDSTRIKSTTEETTMTPRPFSYLTGRTLPIPNEKVDDRAMQCIQYHSMGKVKVMEVPLCPPKLSSKPTQEEPSIWQLIASRFRRKEQTYSGKCELQQSQSKSSSQFPPGYNKSSQSVTIETVAGINSHKGQGKISRLDWNLFPSFDFHFYPPFYFKESYSPCETRKCAFLGGQANESHMGKCESG